MCPNSSDGQTGTREADRLVGPATTTRMRRAVAIATLVVCVMTGFTLVRRAGALFSVKGRQGRLGRPSSFLFASASSEAITYMGNNPLKVKHSLPKFADVTTDNIREAIKIDIEKLQHDFSSFENVLRNPTTLGSVFGKTRKEYDFSMVIDELEKVQAGLSYDWSLVGHLMGVKNSDELRKAHEEVQASVIEIFQKIGQSKPLFNALTALKKRESIWKDFDETQRRIITAQINSMENSGIGLDEANQQKYNKLQLEISKLATKFSNNVLDSTKEFKLMITDKIDVEGLPSSALALCSQSAKNAGEAASTPENGPWLITLDMPSYLPAMQNLKSSSIREKLYRAFVMRASAQSNPTYDNEPIIKQLLQLKTEASKLLGYSNFAEKSLSRKMAKRIEAVQSLTDLLYVKAYPAAARELDELKAFAKEEGLQGELQLWDVPFYSELQKKKLFDYSEEDIRPYFPFPTVLQGLFDVIQRLFGVRIEAADGEAQVWSDDVRFFKIFDEETNEHISSFYLDPYSRPAEKRGGAWMDVCQGASRVLGNKPVAYLVCNGPSPVGDKPSLMSFREVETLFHEFGHMLQHCLTRVTHADAAGINNIEWDAVELPSQFMENFCYDEKTVYGFAKHYETKEPLPKEIFEKIKKSKNYQSGLQMLRQLYFGTLDMTLHSSYDPYSSKSVAELQQEIASKYTALKPLAEDKFLCSFSHIFAGGYSAGYYSYKWAEVMSADAFSAFEEAGLENAEGVRALGRRFRETVLSKGGGEDPESVFAEFRGRKPSPDALLRHSNLV